MMKKLLLHICCAPCCTIPLVRLKDQGFLVTAFFYNPNIQPSEEHDLRLQEVQRFLSLEGIDLIIDLTSRERWFALTKGLEKEPEGEKRCLICYEMRMQKTAQYAKEHGFSAFAVTLTLSPHKKVEKINEIGCRLSREIRIFYLETDFKKQEGFKKSVELSKKYGFYRQTYCGCLYSKPLIKFS